MTHINLEADQRRAIRSHRTPTESGQPRRLSGHLASWVVLGCLIAAPVAAETITGRVVGVSDGDTLTLLDASKTQHKIRLSGIDAPEKKQAFGERSKKGLSDCAFDKTAEVETHKVDRYQRKVGRVMVNGRDCNLLQIQQGLAWHYKQYAKEQPADERDQYATAEEQARSRKLAIWSEPNPTPPWEFRKNSR